MTAHAYAPITCATCGVVTPRTSSRQRFCPPCGKIAKSYQVRKWKEQHAVRGNRAARPASWSVRSRTAQLNEVERELKRDCGNSPCWLCRYRPACKDGVLTGAPLPCVTWALGEAGND